MANIQILDNSTINQLLINLSKEEAIGFRTIVEQTFEDFSIGNERQYQPMPSTVQRENGQHTLFRPFTSDGSVGTKITVEPAPKPDGSRDPLHGVIVLCDGTGNPTGLLGGEEVTGYRTSMNAMVPFSWRKNVEKILIFGTGVQAIWHTRLILTLRGTEVKSITYVNPGRKNDVDRVVAKVSSENSTLWRSSCTFHGIYDHPTSSTYQQKITASLRDADCIFCTTPSKTPLFAAEHLIHRREQGHQPFVCAIGSWQPEMIEVDPSVLYSAIAAPNAYNPMTGESRGVVLVDDRDFGLEHCGELVKSKVGAGDIVELGEIIALRKAKAKQNLLNTEHVRKVDEFISEGFVVYKSVGVSLTDLTVSNAILGLSRRQHRL